MIIVVLYLILAGSSLVLLVAGIVEQRNHLRQLHSIPHRVLVNGIRGKSSITRLTAGALRGGGQVVVAKTTGTAARFIFPDGSEEPVYRKFGIANVIEQLAIVARAAAYHPDVLVVECMAVQPALQELSQAKLIQSSIGVLSNVRADHLAEMGPTLADVARSLSRAMPVGGVCVTAERRQLPQLQAEAERRRCRLIVVDPATVTDDELGKFDWIPFRDNVAIALKVSELLGVSRAAALHGMWAAQPDPGALRVLHHPTATGVLTVANVFAANDPESTLANVRQLQEQGLLPGQLSVLINCRPDRIERNAQMGALAGELDPHRIVLIGDPTRSARAAVPTAVRDRVTDLGGRRESRALLADVCRAVPAPASLVLVGNIHGQGEALLSALADLPAAPAAFVPRQRAPHEALTGEV